MSRTLTIDNVEIGDDFDCYVIAEIGNNHQGELEKAKELFRAAAAAGARAVKLQKRDNATLFTRAQYESPYENENSFGPTYGAHREALEFGREEYVELIAFAKSLGTTLFATAFDFNSADFLAALDMPAYKIASADLRNTPLLKHVAAIGKPMIVSTGGGTMDDVRRMADAVLPINPQLCILQCTAAYPVEPEEMNIRVVETFRREFPSAVVGLSDHQDGIAMSLLAYMLGARVFEKHLTLHRSWKGTDHAFSLEPGGLGKLVRDLKRARGALGDGIKRVLPTEIKPIVKMSKKLVAARDLPAGRPLTREDVAMKCPGDGLPPYELDRVLGRKLAVPLAEDQAILFEALEPEGR